MRIIPKRTKVRMELFKGIELVDVLVAGAGMGHQRLLSGLQSPRESSSFRNCSSYHSGPCGSIEDDKGYILLFNVLKYLGRYRVFYKRSALQGKKGAGTGTGRGAGRWQEKEALSWRRQKEGGLRACRGYLWRISRPLRELTAITLSMAPPTVRWS